MLLAESAVLLCFHTVRMSFLVLRHVVVALFAFCTCQCNLCAHDFHLHLYYRSSHLPLRYLILSIKKRPKLFHSPVYYTIEISIRQGIFVDLWGLAVGFMGVGRVYRSGWERTHWGQMGRPGHAEDGRSRNGLGEACQGATGRDGDGLLWARQGSPGGLRIDGAGTNALGQTGGAGHTVGGYLKIIVHAR